MSRRILEQVDAGLRELEDEIQTCNRCGSCQSFCPLYLQTRKEGDTSRGKLALLRGIRERAVTDPQAVRRVLDRCVLCGTCSRKCPRGVNPMETFLKARGILSEIIGLPVALRMALREVVAKPERMDRVLSQLAERSPAFPPRLPAVVERRLPDLPSVFLAKVPARQALAGVHGTGDPVSFFVGCVTDRVMPDTAVDTVRVLQYLGFSVDVPKEQGCCGMPNLASGDRRGFRDLVRYHIERFDPSCPLTTPCATCTAAIRHHWPAAPGLTPGERKRAERLAKQAVEVHVLAASRLDRLAGLQDAPALTLTWHDPCHAPREGLAAPRDLFSRLPGVDLKEMPEPERCCGSGGSFRIKDPAAAAGIGAVKREGILATGAGVVGTSCPACCMQLTDALSGTGIAVKNGMSILAERLGLHDGFTDDGKQEFSET